MIAVAGAALFRRVSVTRVAGPEIGPQPLPTNGIFVAITVMNCTFASGGRLAM